MDFFIGIFNAVLYQPLFNALVLLYEYLPGHDFGVAVIVLTVLTRLLFFPLGSKAIQSQRAMSEIQPKLRAIQEKYKDNKEQQARATMDLYKEEKISPLSGCLPLLIQLPLLIAMYQVFWRGLRPESLQYLYAFVPFSGQINPLSFGFLDLSKPNWILAVLAGVGQFFQTKMMTTSSKKADLGVDGAGKTDKTSQFSDIMQKQTLYFFPIFTVIILFRLPAAIGIYWIVSTLFTIFQQYLILKKKAK